MSILSPKFKTIEYYSDIPKTLDLIPGRSDLSRKINENAVRESIRNIVLTAPGEKPFQPEFGCGIKALLFEPMTPTILEIIRDVVKKSIITFEPRCEVLGVDVTGDYNESVMFVTVVFRVINTDAISNVDIKVKRVL